MKGTEFMQLKPGQLVRLRKTGPGARDNDAEDEFDIARIATADRYKADRYARGGETITVEGLTFRGRADIDPDGTDRLVVAERLLRSHSEQADDGSWPWIAHRDDAWDKLRMVQARDVIGVWDDQIEAAALAERKARFDARKQAELRTADQWAAAVAERQAAAELLQPVLDAAGVRLPDRWAVQQGDRSFTVTDMLKVASVAWSQGRGSLAEDFAKPIGDNGMRPATPNPYEQGL